MRYFFCESCVLLMSCVCHAFASVHCCLVVTCWERANLLALVWMSNCDFVSFPCDILGQVWYFIVLIPDLCRLSYFYLHPYIVLCKGEQRRLCPTDKLGHKIQCIWRAKISLLIFDIRNIFEKWGEASTGILCCV